MARVKVSRGSGNVFRDLGFDAIEAEELTVKTDLVTLLGRILRARRLTQAVAARICGVDQPTISKVLGGRLDSITIDRLARWIAALGGRVRIAVEPPPAGARARKGSITVLAAVR